MPLPFSDSAARQDQDLQQDPRARELSRIASIIRFALIITLIMLAVWLIGDVIAVIFASALLAIVLHGLARLIRRPLPFLPYPLAVSLVALAITAAVGFLFWHSGPAIGDQFVRLKAALIQQSGQLKSRLGDSTVGQMILDHLPSSLGGTDKTNILGSLGSGFAGSVTGLLGSALGILGTLAVILISGLYFALSPALYINGLLRLVPPRHRDTARELLFTAGNTLWAWTAGQALDMLVVGVLTGIGLTLIGIPLALALGVIAGLMNFIPYIGAISGAIPAILIALSVGTQEALLVSGLYVVVQFFEGNVLAPFIQRRAVHMPPALAILSQTVFGSILGISGLILASPLTAALLAMGDKATAPLEDADRTPVETDEKTAEQVKDEKNTGKV